MRVPGGLRDGEEVVADEVRGQHDLAHHLVELHVLHVRQRVVLAVDRAGLQAGIDLGIGHRRRVGAERLAEELPGVAAGHPQLDPGHVGGGLDLRLRLQPDLAGAEVGRAEDLDAELLLGAADHLLAEVAGEEGAHVVGVAEDVGRGQDRELGHLVGDVLRRDVAHLEVAALERDELGALLEQVAAVVGLEGEALAERLGELLRHLRPDVLVREHRGEAQLLACPARARAARGRRRWRRPTKARRESETVMAGFLP